MLFAILRDAAGTGEVTLEIPAGSRVSSVKEILAQKYPMLAKYLPRIAFAVNRSYVAADTELQAGDEVALIPPVSGG
jgi:molybdopterin converting factor subunit 1